MKRVEGNANARIAQTVSYFVSVLLVNLLIQDGKSNYMEGLMLITLYLVIALACTSPFPPFPRATAHNMCFAVWVS